MTVTIEGNYPYILRVPTGLDSLDECLASASNERGMPLRSVYEIYGSPQSGKSSLAYYLSGRVAPKGRIMICDLEGMDREYLRSSLGQAGFEGVGRIVESYDPKKKKPRLHEAMLTETAESLSDPAVISVIVDSVGAIIPAAQMESELGEAVIGRRAKLTGDTATRAMMWLNAVEQPKAAFFINHVHAIIGGRGHLTAGGVKLKHMAMVRLFLKTAEVITAGDDPIAYVSEGTLEKLRFGRRGRKCRFAILPGIGVSPHLTALLDCVALGIAKRESTVKLKGKSVGYLSKLIEGLYHDNTAKFDPFFEALQDYRCKETGLIPDGLEGSDNYERTDLDELDVEGE